MTGVGLRLKYTSIAPRLVKKGWIICPLFVSTPRGTLRCWIQCLKKQIRSKEICIINTIVPSRAVFVAAITRATLFLTF